MHAESGNFLHFPLPGEVCGVDEERTDEPKQVVVGVSESRLTAYNERFVGFASNDDVCCFLASPFTAYADICQQLSQTVGVDEAALREDLIEFKVVPDLKRDEKDHLVVLLATKVRVRLLALREEAQHALGLFCSTCVVMRIRILGYESYKERTLGPVDEQVVG